jgi:phenylalanyl-tRNA synthetase alpha chain
MFLNCFTFEKVLSSIDKIKKMEDLENLRKEFIGKNGFFTLELRNIRDIPLEERTEKGLLLNSYKKKFLTAVQKKKRIFTLL